MFAPLIVLDLHKNLPHRRFQFSCPSVYSPLINHVPIKNFACLPSRLFSGSVGQTTLTAQFKGIIHLRHHSLKHLILFCKPKFRDTLLCDTTSVMLEYLMLVKLRKTGTRLFILYILDTFFLHLVSKSIYERYLHNLPHVHRTLSRIIMYNLGSTFRTIAVGRNLPHFISRNSLLSLPSRNRD